jgi:hypothetical protein
MDTFLTLVIALGGIATGIGAIWTAFLARRQARFTEQSLDEQRQFLKEQNRSLAEQNQHVRLNLEVDLLIRLEDRFDSPRMLATRKRAAEYIKDTFFLDGSLREVHTLNRDAWDVLNFFEDLGYFVKIGAVRPFTIWRTFGWWSFAYWALGKPAIANERRRTKEPKLYEGWEHLMDKLFEISHRSGEEFEGEFTEEQLREIIEEECFAGEAPPSKG